MVLGIRGRVCVKRKWEGWVYNVAGMLCTG